MPCTAITRKRAAPSRSFLASWSASDSCQRLERVQRAPDRQPIRLVLLPRQRSVSRRDEEPARSNWVRPHRAQARRQQLGEDGSRCRWVLPQSGIRRRLHGRPRGPEQVRRRLSETVTSDQRLDLCERCLAACAGQDGLMSLAGRPGGGCVAVNLRFEVIPASGPAFGGTRGCQHRTSIPLLDQNGAGSTATNRPLVEWRRSGVGPVRARRRPLGP